MKKKSKKWKIVLAVSLAVIIIGGAVTFQVYRTEKSKLEVNLAELTIGNVVKTFSTSAPVESASTSVFYAIDGVRVLDVNVKVGDVVEPGTLMATFDPSSVEEARQEKQRAADNAATAYSDALKAAESAKEALPAIETEIEKLEQEGESTSGTATTPSFDISSILGSLGGILGGSGLDLSSMMGSSFTSQSQLAQLQIQKIVLETQMSDSYLNSLKQKRDTTKATLDVFLSQLDLLEKGWTAEKRGIVSTVSINPGTVFTAANSNTAASGLDMSSLMGMLSGDVDITSLLSMFTGSGDSSAAASLAANIGMVVENYDEFLASFTLGKFDMPNVKLGQRAIIKSVNKEYEGEVSFISATASSSSSINITSIMGGVSGSSSAAEGIVTIKSPDEGIVIGFDVDIDIVTDEAFNVMTLPVEAVRWTPEGKASVYVYNQKSKKIEYREIETGISDSSTIQVLSGLSEGDKVVRNVLSGSSKLLADGLKIRVNTEEASSVGTTG
ncbi:MAG: hypothetical protein LBS36_04390 [Oscillospiraceae bacterium]|jgi:multidrug efflux pump subunit AcrA (membrane-fusion protein)|nr:hypothetical protein [Oscillospiraceae bacterium]